MDYRYLPLLLLLTALFGGCSSDQPPLTAVSGRVVMDGAGVTAGAIYFHPDSTNSFQKDSPSSQLQLDGSFVMKTFPFGDGVPPGKYKVTLVPELAARIKHPEYGNAEETPWEIEVLDSEIRDHTFEVK